MAFRKNIRQQIFEDISDDPELEKFLLDVKNGKAKPKFGKLISHAQELLG